MPLTRHQAALQSSTGQSHTMDTPASFVPTSPPASTTDLTINGIVFATAAELAQSHRLSKDTTDPYSLADRLCKISKIAKLFKLTPEGYTKWCQKVRDHIALTSSAAAFQPDASGSIVSLWQDYWTAKLKAVAPATISISSTATPLEILSLLVSSVAAQTDASRGKFVTAFLGLRPQRTLASLLAEIEKSQQPFLSLFPDALDDEKELAKFYQIMVCHHVRSINMELGLTCTNLPLSRTLTVLRTHTAAPPTPSASARTEQRKSALKCTFCDRKGHSEAECHKKHGYPTRNASSVGNRQAKAIRKRQTAASTFQLDTAADQHVAFNENDFSSYSCCTSRNVELADGSTVPVQGVGALKVPTQTGPIILRDAIHIKGKGPVLLSLARLQDAGYHLQTRQDNALEVRHHSKATTILFSRKGNRFLWQPDTSTDWHATLGHVNPRAIMTTLERHGVKSPAPPSTKECTACVQAKFSASPGKGHLIHEAQRFIDVLHIDLVGGKDALPPSTGASDVPAATMALTIIDEHTRFKWAIPLHAKSDAPIQLKGLLLQLQSRFSRLPFRIHSDRGSEFVCGTLTDWLTEHGVQWTGSAAHAHQQNGLIERTNRTIFEALRASHLHANLPAKLWATTLISIVNILNSTASKLNDKSPHEKAYGTAPELPREPLGCRVLFKKDDKAPLPKLAPRTTDGVFLGKHHGVAHIFDLSTKRVITRRDYTPFVNEFPLRLSQAAAIRPSPSGVSVSTALSSGDREAWYKAMDKEIQAMHDLEVWTLVPKDSLPSGTKIMSGTWVLRTKPNGDFKARWCARGFSEPDVDTAYADVLQAVSMRLFFAYAAQHQYNVRHIDITSAFLNAPLDTPIYLQQPLHLPRVPGMVCCLNKAIYGLRTAPRRWQQTLAHALLLKGFTPLKGDRNIYKRGPVLMSVYVDDFKITGPDHDIEATVKELKSLYEVKDLGTISHYLGMDVARTATGGYQLSQREKIAGVIKILELENARPSHIPVPDDNQIDQDTENVLQHDQATLYRKAVGQLLHISLITRPDIAYAAMRLAQRFAMPTTNALRSLKAVGKYLLGTRNRCLTYCRADSTILGSSDSSWSTASQSRATTGNVFMVNGSPVAWRAKRQSLTAQSTCEAEYVAASTAATEARWLLPLVNELWQQDHGPIRLQMDNQAAIATAKADGMTARNRHFLIRQAVLREAIADNIIAIAYTPTDQVIADGLTKGLQKQKHAEFLSLLNLGSVEGGVLGPNIT